MQRTCLADAKCVAGGKISFEVMKGRKGIEPIAEFGKHAFFRPPKTKNEKGLKD